MESERINGSVALVTGGAHGIGAAIGRRLAGLGAKVVLADVDAAAGPVVAHEIGGLFVRCDVGRLADNEAAVAAAVRPDGGPGIAAPNAGGAPGFRIGDRLHPPGEPRAEGHNLRRGAYR